MPVRTTSGRSVWPRYSRQYRMTALMSAIEDAAQALVSVGLCRNMRVQREFGRARRPWDSCAITGADSEGIRKKIGKQTEPWHLVTREVV